MGYRNRNLLILDRQHDEAWIGGPGIGGSFGGANLGWIDENTCWFQSEATGYSHLYTINVLTKQKNCVNLRQIRGAKCTAIKNKKTFYISTNEVHPGEQQFYRLGVNGGKAERITTLTGANQVAVSPDEKILPSYIPIPINPGSYTYRKINQAAN